MGQLSWAPNSPTGGDHFCESQATCVRSWIASLCLYELLEQSGRVPDEMMDVLLGGRGDVVCWNNTWRLRGARLDSRLTNRLGKWIAWAPPSSRTCWPPSSHRRLSTAGWALLGNGSNTEQQSALLSLLLARLLRVSLRNIRRWAEMFAAAKTKPAPPAPAFLLCVSTNACFSKCPTSWQTCWTIRSLQCKTRF